MKKAVLIIILFFVCMNMSFAGSVRGRVYFNGSTISTSGIVVQILDEEHHVSYAGVVDGSGYFFIEYVPDCLINVENFCCVGYAIDAIICPRILTEDGPIYVLILSPYPLIMT